MYHYFDFFLKRRLTSIIMFIGLMKMYNWGIFILHQMNVSNKLRVFETLEINMFCFIDLYCDVYYSV